MRSKHTASMASGDAKTILAVLIPAVQCDKTSASSSIEYSRALVDITTHDAQFIVPLDTQVKLLRVLEEKAVTPIGSEKKISTDIRIIAATNVNLKNAIRKGRFREDLYYRLSVVEITMPSLRDHLEDLPLLFHYFTKLFCIL